MSDFDPDALAQFVAGALRELADPRSDAGQGHRAARTQSPADRVAALEREASLADGPEAFDERPDDISPGAWSSLSAGQRREILDLRADADEDEAGGDDDEEIEEEAAPPLSGNERLDAIRDLISGTLADRDGEYGRSGEDPEEAVLWMISCSAADWQAYARANHWPESARPGRADLPVELEVKLARRNLLANLQREASGYRAP